MLKCRYRISQWIANKQTRTHITIAIARLTNSRNPRTLLQGWILQRMPLFYLQRVEATLLKVPNFCNHTKPRLSFVLHGSILQRDRPPSRRERQVHMRGRYSSDDDTHQSGGDCTPWTQVIVFSAAVRSIVVIEHRSPSPTGTPPLRCGRRQGRCGAPSGDPAPAAGAGSGRQCGGWSRS